MSSEKKYSIFTVCVVVIAILGVLFAISIPIIVVTSQGDAFDNAAGIVIEKVDGHGLQFNRVTVEIHYNSIFGSHFFEKVYIVSDEVFSNLELGSLYDGDSALGYVSSHEYLFVSDEDYIFYESEDNQ